MNVDEQYTGSHRMRDLISDNPSLLMALTRFGISLGFGDKSVDEVCVQNGLHTGTFLVVANFISGRKWRIEDLSLPTLMGYLKNAHEYFLAFVLPMIRRKLIEAIDCSRADGLGFLILRFFDGYVTEVAGHMEFENNTVFPYVERLLEGEFSEEFSIGKFVSRHARIDPKLKELQDIIIRYYPEKGDDLLNSVLFDIITLERDLHLHCMAEDRLFAPSVRALEQEVERNAVSGERKRLNDGDAEPPGADKSSLLSDREKEIVAMVAKGFANKEIADALCLSVHTVATHRRNISSKLQIHSAAGLTIFAIVSGLISLSELPAPR